MVLAEVGAAVDGSAVGFDDGVTVGGDVVGANVTPAYAHRTAVNSSERQWRQCTCPLSGSSTPPLDSSTQG